MLNYTLRYIHPSIQYIPTNYTFNTTTSLPNYLNTITIPHILKLCIALVVIYIIVDSIGHLYVKMRECNRKITNNNKIVMFIKEKVGRSAPELPFTMPKKEKAKESPYIAPEIPKILPTCPTLDGVEKGQNLMVRFRMPYNSKKTVEPFTVNLEHRITINTNMENEEDILTLDSPV